MAHKGCNRFCYAHSCLGRGANCPNEAVLFRKLLKVLVSHEFFESVALLGKILDQIVFIKNKNHWYPLRLLLAVFLVELSLVLRNKLVYLALPVGRVFYAAHVCDVCQHKSS